MGFFKSVKKKLNLFKRQLRKVIPNEIVENPAVTAALIIGGNIPFGQAQESLFARGASNVSEMFSSPSSYFTNLNDRFGFGKKYIGTMVSDGKRTDLYKKTGFLGKAVEGVTDFVDENPFVKKVGKAAYDKFLKDDEKPSTGQQIAGIDPYSYRRNYSRPSSGQTAFRPSTTPKVQPGYRNRYVQSSLYNILSNPNYKQIWSGGINAGEMISIYQSSGPTVKLESSKLS